MEYPRQFFISSISYKSTSVGDETTVTNDSYGMKTKVKPFHWNIGVEYGIYIYCGDGTSIEAANSQPIITQYVLCEVITQTEKALHVSPVDTEPMDAFLTWFFQNVNKEQTMYSEFSVGRVKESHRTSRKMMTFANHGIFLGA